MQIIIEKPSVHKDSLIFDTERDMFSWYLSLWDELDFRWEDNLSEKTVEAILLNKHKPILYTNI